MPGGEKAVRRKGGHPNCPSGLRDDLLQHSLRNTRNTQIRSSESKQLSVSMRKRFEHLVSHTVSSFFDAKNLCTGVKRRDNECTCVISFREENFELLGPQRRKLFSKFLGLQVTCTDGLRNWSALPEWTTNFVGDTIVFTSSHKVLTYGSYLEHKPG